MFSLVVVATGCFSFFIPASAQSVTKTKLQVVTGPVSEDGHLKLAWEMSDASDRVEVQQSTDKEFNGAIRVYRGPDNATVISGLENGTYYFRLKHIDGEWSDTARVIVRHHSLTLALTLCVLGALVFLCTVAVVVTGVRNHAEQ